MATLEYKTFCNRGGWPIPPPISQPKSYIVYDIKIKFTLR